MAHPRLLNGMFKVAIGIAGTIALTYATWTANRILNHGERIVAIEASRFTSKDGLEVWKQIGSIREELARAAPPDWLIARLDRLDAKIDNLGEVPCRP